MFKPNSGRKQESSVWKYFDYETSMDKSMCKVENCGSALKGKNATNLMNHLKSKHKDIATSLSTKENNDADATLPMLQQFVVLGSSQPKLTSFIQDQNEKKQKWNKDVPQTKLRDELWTKIFMSTGLPTTILNNPDVLEYHAVTDPKYSIPNPAHMLKLLSGAHSRMCLNIKEDLKLARQIVISMDCWSKKSLTASYLCVSASFYHPSRHQPVHVILNLHQIDHPHTGEMLADKLLSTLTAWNINRSKVLFIVTDNGSNMIKAVKVANVEKESIDDLESDESDEEETDSDTENIDVEDTGLEDMVQLHRLPCIAHTLQLVVKQLEKNQTYRTLTSKVKGLVKFIKISSVAQEKLMNLCGKVVVKDCVTRWNSILFVVDRLLTVRVPLEQVLKELKHDSLTNTEWECVADLHRLLQPFAEMTDSLQTDTLSLSSFIPAVTELSLHLQDTSLPKLQAQMLLQSLRQRFSKFLDTSSPEFDPLPAAACLLDPTVSACMMRAEMLQLFAAAKSYIKEKVYKSAVMPASTTSSTFDEVYQPPLKRFKRLAKEIETSGSPSKQLGHESAAEDELNAYLSTSKSVKLLPNQTGISFWDASETAYPLLAPFAKDLISAPASEAYVERVFSVCGDMTARKRNRLSKKLETRVFLKMNHKYYTC